MELGIVSDTHDNLDLVKEAVTLFEDESVDAVIHCGDFIAPFSVTPFDAGSFDFYAVRGNNDGEWDIKNVIAEFGEYLGEAGELELDDTKIAIYHGTSPVLINGLVDSGTYDYVLHGHTHEHVVEERNGTVRVNPGGLPLSFADDSFHAAIIDTNFDNEDSVTHYELG